MLIDILNQGDICTLSATVLVLLWVGNVVANQTERKVGFGVAGAGFLAYATYAVLFHSPASAEDLLQMTLRSVLASGICLGLCWIALPLIFTSYRSTIGLLIARARRWAREARGLAAERRRQRSEEANRRIAQQEHERTAPERERARQEAEQHAKLQAEAQKRRDDARVACELLYQRHIHALGGSRFPKETFQEYREKYLGDNHPPEYVEERGRQLQEIIRQHVEQLEPPEAPFSIESLATWYQEKKQIIENLEVDKRYKQAQMAHLNARYAELMQALMEDLRP